MKNSFIIELFLITFLNEEWCTYKHFNTLINVQPFISMEEKKIHNKV